MTKYILVGGYPTKAADGGRAFCEALVGGFSEPHRILITCFARPVASWTETFAQEQALIKSFVPNRRIEFQLADPETFTAQAQWAQTIYLKGGDPALLLRDLLRHDAQWKKQLEGKTIAGTSAGAEVVAQYYSLLDTSGVAQGLGLLPIKVLVHYRSDYHAPNIDWDRAFAELQAFGEDLPIKTLGEGQFEILTR